VHAASDVDLAVKQAYVNLLVPMGNGLQLKAGVFNCIIGYESYESYLNPNYGRSYGWQLEPTQHTGLLASYQVTEAVSMSAGIANTWTAGINARDARGETFKTYMASLSITAPDSWGFLSGSSLSAGVVNGGGNLTGSATNNPPPRNTTSFYTGFNILTGVEGLSLGAAFDYRANGANTLTSTLAGEGKNWAYALAGYVSLQASEKWKFNARLDYTRGSDGTYYDAGGTWFAGAYTPNGLSDVQNEFFATTLTADYALWANVISRFELRWDHSTSGDAPFGDSDVNAVTIAANVIYKF
jgi:hypothetical protein